MSIKLTSARAASLGAVAPNIVYNNGALIMDEYDSVIFDDIQRTFVPWASLGIDKRKAVGDFTNGFVQTAIGTARAANKRSLAWSATSPTRSARTPQEVKAIVRDLEFGLYDRSVYAQQGMQFGELSAKDVGDVYTSMFTLWSTLFYDGDAAAGSGYEFNGLKKLITTASTCSAATSVVKTIQDRIVLMMNDAAREVAPTDIIVNARVRQLIAQEYRKVGDRMPEAVNTRGERVGAIDTAAGMLPLHVDKFNAGVAGTPVVYPTWIVTRNLLSWQYIEPLGQAGPEPKLFQFPLTNTIDEQFKGLMFGAMECLGPVYHHYRLNVEDRTTVVDMTA